MLARAAAAGGRTALSRALSANVLLAKRATISGTNTISRMGRANAVAFSTTGDDSHDDFAAIRRSYLDDGSGDGHGKTEKDAVAEVGDIVKQSKIVLFMKGTPLQPRCGFSRLVAQLLAEEGVVDRRSGLLTVDVLSEEEGHLREAVKQFSEWPTFPQVFIAGEFVGGADIMKSLFETGELTTMIADAHAGPAATAEA